jgi:hypothetical protein
MGSNTASVLPLPVGEIKSTFSRFKIRGIALTWGIVGSLKAKLASPFLIGSSSKLKTLEATIPKYSFINKYIL